MELGISSYTYGWGVGVPGSLPPNPLGPLDLLDKAAELGVRLVQIADNMPLHGRSERELDVLRRTSRELGIGIELGTRGLTSDTIEVYVNLARRLDSTILRTLIDMGKQGFSEDGTVACIRKATGALEDTGVYLAIENHDYLSAKTLARIVRKVGSEYVGICLDTTNSLGVPEEIETVVGHLAPFVLNLHVKDFSIRRLPHKLGFIIEGTPAGQGMLNIPWLLEAVQGSKYNPNAILELWTPPEPNLNETIRKEEEWAQSSIKYLRSVMDN